MNIIINGFFEEQFLPIIEQILELPSVEKVLLFRDEIRHPDSIIEEYEGTKLEILPIGKVEKAQYQYAVKYVTPVDNKLLKDFAYCESITLKMMDRLSKIDSYWQRKNLYIKHLQYWNHVFTVNNFDLVIGSNLPHEVYDYVMYEVARYYDVRVLFFHQAAKFPQTVYIVNDLTEFMPEVAQWKKCKDERLSSRMNQFVNKEQTTHAVPFYMKKDKSFIAYFKKAIKYFNRKNAIRRLISRVKDKVFYPITEGRLQREYKSLQTDVLLEEKYIYLPLHFQPELTTSPLAENFVYQEVMVDVLAYALKDYDIKLYVKEHANQRFKGRTLGYYQNISKYPNVNLIRRDSDSFALIEKSMAVATCTGTAALEAIMRLKPVLLFGNFVYKHAPFTYKINTVDDAQKVIQKILNENQDYIYDDVIRYLASIEKSSIHAVVNTAYDRGDLSVEENNKNIYACIRDAIDV